MDLTDAELDELDHLLAETPKPLSPLDVVQLDGYLCAVLVQPRIVPVSDWLAPIFDTDGRSWSVLDDPQSADRTARIEALATRRLAALREQLAAEAWFEPLIPAPQVEAAADPSSPERQPRSADAAAASSDLQIREALAPWASGFEYGLNRVPDLLEALQAAEAAGGSNEQVRDHTAASIALARVLRSLPPLDDEQRAALAELDEAEPLANLDDAIDGLVAGVADLWALTRAARYRVEPRRHAAPKAGRNDPCPCGSGLKFKRCHGQ